ncbi:MAG: IS21 family transposase [Chloroflexi bacterium]|nr:MAG: IS21 family transposase [Chloroflexota bacterium]
MLDPEKVATIRRLYFAEHWKIGTIASELGVHRDTVRAAVETDPLHRPCRLRPSRLDPYLPFLRETLERHPRLRATRLLDMIRQRGYVGSIQRLRCVVARLRPASGEPFLRLVSLPGEQAQVDWAHFGEVVVGRAKRRLSCFVMTLSFSRALFLEFFFDQSQENFFRGHVAAFDFFAGVARVILYDNLKSAVLERQGSAVHFHPRLIELCSHYHFQPRPCAPGKGNQKGKVERAIRYVRESFFEGTRFTTLEDLNGRAWAWRDQMADGGGGLRGRKGAAAPAAPASFRRRAGPAGAAAQGDLGPLRPQPLLDPAPGGGPAAHSRGLRGGRAHPGRPGRDRISPPQLRPRPVRRPGRPRGGPARAQAQGPRTDAFRPPHRRRARDSGLPAGGLRQGRERRLHHPQAPAPARRLRGAGPAGCPERSLGARHASHLLGRLPAGAAPPRGQDPASPSRRPLSPSRPGRPRGPAPSSGDLR